MVEIIRLTCNECKKSYDLNVGQGMKDNRLDRVLTYFDEQTADIVKAKLSLISKPDSWSYRKMIGYCDACKSYLEIPTLWIISDGKEYVTAAKCRCGNTCRLIDDNDGAKMNNLSCPVCGAVMSASNTGIWD